MGKKKVVIIGAGIAGLTLGYHLQRNGFDTEIYEANSYPGGLCTGWEKNGFKIDGCLESLLGVCAANPYYQLLGEMVDIDEISFEYPEVRRMFLFSDGRTFAEYNNLNLLLAAMLETAPEDATVIREFIEDIRKLQKNNLTVDNPGGFSIMGDSWQILNMHAKNLVIKWRDVGPYQFAGRFSNPMLKRVVSCFASPVLEEMFELAAVDGRQAGYPKIGSRAFAGLFEKKYISLGGIVQYAKKVRSILVEKNTAKGLELADGKRVFGDYIVSAMDGRTTVFDLLGGRFVKEELRALYEQANLSPSVIQIAIGLSKTPDVDFTSKKVLFDTMEELPDGSLHSFMDVWMSPVEGDESKTLITVRMETNHDSHWWVLRKSNMQKYLLDKEKVADWTINMIGKRVCPIREDVIMVDVATPATYIRYTGNWKGATRGWMERNILGINSLSLKSELPGLKNFFMTGQWARAGGSVPGVMKNARDTAQSICRKERKIFTVK